MQEMTMVINTERNIKLSPETREPVALSSRQVLEAQLKLSMLLQRSLDPLTLTGYFYQALQKLVMMDGLGLDLDIAKAENNYLLGRKSLHSSSYRLNTDEGFIGEIIFYRGKRFNENELEVLEGFLSVLVFPLQNAIRYQTAVQMTLIDPLTGLGNRLALNHALERDLHLAQRHQKPFSILMIDIDYFKAINDRFGHRCGDDVLIAVANCLRQASRSSDACYRFGGEEFTLLLPGTAAEGAGSIAERIHKMIAALTIPRQEGHIRATISIGIASSDPAIAELAGDILERADKALYQAKANGRNCTWTS